MFRILLHLDPCKIVVRNSFRLFRLVLTVVFVLASVRLIPHVCHELNVFFFRFLFPSITLPYSVCGMPSIFKLTLTRISLLNSEYITISLLPKKHQHAVITIACHYDYNRRMYDFNAMKGTSTSSLGNLSNICQQR